MINRGIHHACQSEYKKKKPTVVHDLDGLQNVAQPRQIGEIDRHVAAVRVHCHPANVNRLASFRTVDALAERRVEVGEKGGVALAGRDGDEANEGRVEELRLVLAAVVCIKSARLDVASSIARLDVRGQEERKRTPSPIQRNGHPSAQRSCECWRDFGGRIRCFELAGDCETSLQSPRSNRQASVLQLGSQIPSPRFSYWPACEAGLKESHLLVHWGTSQE